MPFRGDVTHEVKAATETSGRRKEFLQQLAMDPGGATGGNKHWSHSSCKQFHVWGSQQNTQALKAIQVKVIPQLLKQLNRSVFGFSDIPERNGAILFSEFTSAKEIAEGVQSVWEEC